MSGKPTTRIQVRIPSELKVRLEQEAMKENMDFQTWLRMKLPELQARYPGQISIVDTVNLPISPNPYYPSPTQMPYYPQQPYYQPYNPYYQMQPPPSQMDRFLNEMIKMAQVKMLQDLIKGGTSAEQFIQAWRNQGGAMATSGGKDGGWNWERYQQMQMLQNQQDREMARYQQQIMNAERQLEMARSRGDKGGENKALEMITALITAQSTQSQNFLQQMMALQTTQSQNQQNLFTAAMQGGRESDAKFQNLTNQMWQGQNVMTGQLWQMHVDGLNKEMERIRTEKPKDTLTQLKELIDLRESSPVYKAAFNAAFGVKEESMIGKLIPQLKEWGVDKVIEKMGGALAGALTSITTKPPPAAIPPPTPLPPPQSLENLKLPTSSQPSPMSATSTGIPPMMPSPTVGTPPILPYQTPRTTPQKPQPPAKSTELPEEAVGYSNLNRPETPKVAIPAEEIITIEAPAETPTEVAKPPEPTPKPRRTRKSKK